MHARLGAALGAVVLTLALGGPLGGPLGAEVLAQAADGTGGATVALTLGGTDPKCAELPCYTLTVILQGLGSGRWQTLEAAFTTVPDDKIDCRIFQGSITADSTCSFEYVDHLRTGDVPIFYRVTPEFGSRACVAGTCKTEGQNFSDGVGPGGKTLQAGFNLQSYRLTVSATGSGSGNWILDPAGSPCGTGCSSYLYGATVEIEAFPATGSRFAGWTGACTGQQAQCLIGINGDLETAVIFEPEGTGPTPTVTRRPSATPVASKSPTAAPVTDPPGATSEAPSASPATPLLTPTAGASSATSDAPGTPPVVDPAANEGRGGIQVAIVVVAVILLAAIAIGVAIAMRRQRAA
jgi:Divergent InlB B-repeat domain